MKAMVRGSRGEDVHDVQRRLAALGYRSDPDPAGEFGGATEAAVRAFQQARNVLVDGQVDSLTWQELVEAGYALGDRVLYLRYPFARGDDVRMLQSRLNLLGFNAGREDGILGPRSDHAIREFQRNVGLPVDGIVGATTHQAMLRLRPVGPGPGLSTVLEREAMRDEGSLRGARIAVDAGHGRGDPGETGPTGLDEADVTQELAAALAALLAAHGADPLLLRPGGQNPSESERAHAANAEGVGLLISFHLNAHRDPQAEGATVFYCGREGWASTSGQRLAELIQEELVRRAGLKDGRTHPKWLPLLRETRMPAVRVEPCFVTNPSEERRLREGVLTQQIAAAIVSGIERFFAPAEQMGAESVSPRPPPSAV
jgi:N-acetylmuramoyl-L-alanine amidase